MNKQKLTFLLMVALITTINFTHAQSISGSVVELGSDAPLIGVNILLLNTNKGTTTQIDGSFELTSDTPLPWNLRISHVGYKTREIKISSTLEKVKISLVEDDLGIEEVVVSASRIPEKITDSPSSVSILTAKQIENLAVPSGDPSNLLKNIQGVRIVQNGVNRNIVNLRGRAVRNETRTLFLKDYRPLNAIFTPFYEGDRIPLLPIDIKKIEIVRGPSGVLWGSGVSSGVVHYISKDPFNYPGVSAEVSYGNSFGDKEKGQAAYSNKIDVRYADKNSNNKIGWKLLVSYRNGEDFIWDLTNQEDVFGTGLTPADYWISEASSAGPPPTRDGQWTDFSGNTLNMNGTPGVGNGPWNLIPDFSSLNIEGTLEFKPSKNFHLALVQSYGTSKGNWGNAGVFLREKKTNYNTQLRINIGDLFFSTNYRRIPLFDGTFDSPYQTQYNNTGFTDWGGGNYYDFQLQYPFKLFTNSDVILGVDYKYHNRQFVETFPDGTPNTFPLTGIYNGYAYAVAGGYGQLTHKFNDKLKAVVAGRIDRFKTYGTSFSPKIAFVYNPNKESGFRLSYNQTNTTPSYVRTFLQSAIGRRSNNIKGNLIRHVYGAGLNTTFNSPLTGLSIAGNTLGHHFQGTDVPLQNILNALGETGISVTGTSQGTLYTLENTDSNSPINNATQLNNDKSGFESIQTYELGYKKKGKNFSISADLYYSIEKNVPTAAVALSPGVAFPNLGNDLTNALNNAGVAPSEVTRIVNNAVTQFGTGVTGIVVSDQHQNLGLLNGVSYGFRSYGEIKYFGLDFDTNYTLNENNSLFLTWSWLNKNFFDSNDIGEDPSLNRVYYLNTPENRIRLGYNYDDLGGLFGNISLQYDQDYDANFGDFTGHMPSTTTIDAAVGYKFTPAWKLSLSATNLFDADVYGLPYLPKQGRFIVTTLRYTP